MLKIGITGGIACGKSTICNLFSFLGIPVYNSDLEARNLMQNNDDVRSSLIETFGHDVYQSNGTLNKGYLGKLVFEEANNRAKINAIVHPAVQQHFLQWHANQKAPYSLFESALLFSSGSSKLMDFCITVHSPENERITRLMQRDSISEEQALQKISSQSSQSELIQKANSLIRNSNHDLLMPQVITTHAWLIDIAKNEPVRFRCL